MAEIAKTAAAPKAAKKPSVSPGVLALRKVVDDVHADARVAKKEGKLVGWSSSKFPCELAAAFDLNVMYPENQAAGIAANRDGEIMCQAAEDLGFDNDICGYARISLAYAAGKRAAFKFDPETLEDVIDPKSGKPLKDADGNVVIDEATGKPKKDPKTQQPYTVLVDIHEIEALPDGPLKDKYWASIKPYRQMQIPQPDFVLCCNNICNCMTKWYENIARMHNIPLIMIDVPYNNTVEVDDTYVAYIRGQFDNAIRQLHHTPKADRLAKMRHKPAHFPASLDPAFPPPAAVRAKRFVLRIKSVAKDMDFPVQSAGQLRCGDHIDAQRFSGFLRSSDALDAVVICDGNPVKSLCRRPLYDFAGHQHAVRRRCVQVKVCFHSSPNIRRTPRQ